MSKYKSEEDEFDEVISNDKIDPHDVWKVVDAYFNQHSLVNQQILSYNQFT